MFINTDDLTPIERADLAQRLARRQMNDAVDALIDAQGRTVNAAVILLGRVYRHQGRIEAIKCARKGWGLDLRHARCVVDSLAARYGAHFTAPDYVRF